MVLPVHGRVSPTWVLPGVADPLFESALELHASSPNENRTRIVKAFVVIVSPCRSSVRPRAHYGAILRAAQSHGVAALQNDEDGYHHQEHHAAHHRGRHPPEVVVGE